MLELWGMQSTNSLPLLPSPLWPRVVVSDRVLFLDQIELIRGFESLLFLHLNCVYMLNRIARKYTYVYIYIERERGERERDPYADRG